MKNKVEISRLDFIRLQEHALNSREIMDIFFKKNIGDIKLTEDILKKVLITLICSQIEIISDVEEYRRAVIDHHNMLDVIMNFILKGESNDGTN